MDFKKILKAIGYPPTWLLAVLSVLSVGTLPLAFLYFGTEHVASYICYALSAYTLTVLCLRVPAIIAFVKRLRNENKYVIRYFSDRVLRTKISLYASLALNSAYALLQLGLGIYHSSVWFYSFAVYYMLLVIMRYFVLRDVRQMSGEADAESEYRRYRFCGIMLVPMNASLAGIVLYITRFGYGITHHYITTIALAAYTFTSMTLAIVGAVRYRKLKSPVLSAAKAISLTSAAVSMLTLETAMLSAFGEEGDEVFRAVITAASGTAVCTLVLVMGVYMIFNATRELKRIRSMSFDERTE